MGTSCVFLAFYLYDHDNLLPFRVLTSTVALISWLLVRYTSRHAAAIPVDQSETVLVKESEAKAIDAKLNKGAEDGHHSFFAVAKQAGRHPPLSLG